MKKGEILKGRVEYLIECQFCSNQERILEWTKRMLEGTLQGRGWRKRRKKWTCPACIQYEKDHPGYIQHELFDRR